MQNLHRRKYNAPVILSGHEPLGEPLHPRTSAIEAPHRLQRSPASPPGGRSPGPPSPETFCCPRAPLPGALALVDLQAATVNGRSSCAVWTQDSDASDSDSDASACSSDFSSHAAVRIADLYLILASERSKTFSYVRNGLGPRAPRTAPRIARRRPTQPRTVRVAAAAKRATRAQALCGSHQVGAANIPATAGCQQEQPEPGR